MLVDLERVVVAMAVGAQPVADFSTYFMIDPLPLSC